MNVRISSSLIRFFVIWTAISIFCAASHAQTIPDTNASGTPALVYSVRPVVFSYGGNNDGLPELQNLEKAFVELDSLSTPVLLADLFSTEGDAA